MIDDDVLDIDDHGIIGDLRTAALVSDQGAITFLCAPRFDSPSIFASLLDCDRGGHFRITAEGDVRRRQMYLPDTNVLITRFLSEQGTSEVCDFMIVGAPVQTLVRQVRCVREQVRFRLELAPRFDYARGSHRAERRDGCVLFLPERGPLMRLHSPVPLELSDGDATAEFTLSHGEVASFVLDFPDGDGREASPYFGEDAAQLAFQDTVSYWRDWIARSTYAGRWLDMVHRSALVLKLLSSRQYGSMVAAPTFGLPEQVGGERNWDYRYTWVRDAAFVLDALTRIGITDEAGRFVQWLETVCTGQGASEALAPFYGLDGGGDLDEIVLPHLSGYRGSRPVRIGNGAHTQLQLDAYGELLDALYLYDERGSPLHHDVWAMVTRLVNWVCDNWRRDDESIWETRGGSHDFLHSRVMCWVAIDRALRIAQRRSRPAPVARWRAVRDEIYGNVFDCFWNAERGFFVQHLGVEAIDASSLLMPLVDFISPTDPHWLSHMQALEERLVEDSLVYRYRVTAGAGDGLEGQEGTFSICTFWWVDCLARAGEVDRARLVFEKMLGYANHLGLFAEQIGRRGEQLGNYPQALTHLGLISAACQLDSALRDPHTRMRRLRRRSVRHRLA